MEADKVTRTATYAVAKGRIVASTHDTYAEANKALSLALDEHFAASDEPHNMSIHRMSKAVQVGDTIQWTDVIE